MWKHANEYNLWPQTHSILKLYIVQQSVDNCATKLGNEMKIIKFCLPIGERGWKWWKEEKKIYKINKSQWIYFYSVAQHKIKIDFEFVCIGRVYARNLCDGIE